MAEYIEREALIKKLEDRITNPTNAFINNVLIGLLEKAPAADVAEVRHGKWQTCFEDWRKQIEGDECSVCGFQYYGTNIRNYLYCPNCGARKEVDTE